MIRTFGIRGRRNLTWRYTQISRLQIRTYPRCLSHISSECTIGILRLKGKDLSNLRPSVSRARKFAAQFVTRIRRGVENIATAGDQPFVAAEPKNHLLYRAFFSRAVTR